MNEKKQSANWVVALVHVILVVFISAILSSIFLLWIGALFILLNEGGLGFFDENKAKIAYLVFPIVTLLSTWLGVRFSARHLNKRYIIKDIQKVIILATIYMVAIEMSFNLFPMFIGSITSSLFDYIAVFSNFIITLIVFYVISKKYIKNDELAIPKYIIDKKINAAVAIIVILSIAVIAGITTLFMIEKTLNF